MAHMFETGFFAEMPAWHGLGVVGERALSVPEAIQMSGLDWKVEPTPIYVNGEEVAGYKANVRSSDGQVLAVVTDRFKVIQNEEGFGVLEWMLAHDNVLIEAATSLKGGRIVTMLARIPQDYTILGDTLRPYLLFANSHDGTMAATIKPVNMRVECWNKLQIALSEKGVSATIRHTGNVRDKMHVAAQALGVSEQHIKILQKEAETFSRYRLPSEAWRRVVMDLIPVPEDSTERTRKVRHEQRRSMYRYIHREDLANHWINGQPTGWCGLQAVVDYVMHEPPVRKRANWAETRFSDIILGESEMVVKAAEAILREGTLVPA